MGPAYCFYMGASQKWRFGFQKRLFSIFGIPCPKGDLCKTIATFAKAQNVMGKFKKDRTAWTTCPKPITAMIKKIFSRQTREPPKFYFDSS